MGKKKECNDRIAVLLLRFLENTGKLALKLTQDVCNVVILTIFLL